MIIRVAIGAGPNILPGALPRLMEIFQKAIRICGGKFDANPDEVALPGETWQQVHDPVQVAGSDVEPYVERDGGECRAVRSIAEPVDLIPTIDTEKIGRASCRERVCQYV